MKRERPYYVFAGLVVFWWIVVAVVLVGAWLEMTGQGPHGGKVPQL
jgi:hypothetical protein